MKKIIIIMITVLLIFSITSCTTNTSNSTEELEELLEELEDDGFELYIYDNTYPSVNVSRDLLYPKLTFIIVEEKVAYIMFEDLDKTLSRAGIVSTISDNAKKSLTIDKQQSKYYQDFLEDENYSEEELIEAIEWYFKENYST